MDVEMSLDDIIMQKKFLLGGSEGKRGGMQGGHKSGALPKSTASTQGKLGGGVKRGSISKGNGPNLKRAALNSGNSIRKHGTSSDTTKLIVSNLDYGVTDSDIVELFTEFGPLKFAGVHYNKFGRSMGSADLVFQRRADAFKAMKEYNGVPLDGREMNIQLVKSVIPGTEGSNPQSRGLANQTRAQNGGVNYKQKSGAAKRAAKAARNHFSKEVPTAEELDAELDEYVKNKILPEYTV